MERITIIDVVIVAIALFYGIEGFANGFVASVLDIISFLLAFAAGLKLYTFFGSVMSALTHVPRELTNPIGFVIAALLAELLFRFIQERVIKLLHKSPYLLPNKLILIDRIMGIIPGVFSGMVLTAFLLTVFTVIPVSSDLKSAITNAKLGNLLVSQGQGFERNLMELFGKKSNDLLTFFTIEPQDTQTISLGFTIKNPSVLTGSEEQMLELVNGERVKNGLAPLILDNQLQTVARAHAADMLEKGYFSHVSPDGKTPFDRMTDAGIQYSYAGENLALSASVELAMQGLMASPGHKANILSPNFHKVGIGAVDAGIYGEMFAQEFTD